MKLNLLIFSIALSCSTVVVAQSNKPDYSRDPVWIKMIDDPKANYYEATNAYEAYWKSHAKPIQEDDEIGEGLSKKEKRERERAERARKRMTTAQREEYMNMKYQCKRFENWIHEVQPYVQEDGRILTMEERTAIWQKQQDEMKRQGR